MFYFCSYDQTLAPGARIATGTRPFAGAKEAWNNTLSVIQQSVIMRKHGAKIELIDNIRDMFGKKKDSKT